MNRIRPARSVIVLGGSTARWVTLCGVACALLLGCSKAAPGTATPSAVAEVTAAPNAPMTTECSWETPLAPGIPGSPGHLIPSKTNPNGMSELAALMREMLAELSAMRADLLAGKPVGDIGAAHARLRCSWPTVASDRNAAYDAMAVAYLANVEAFNAAPEPGPAEFDAVVKGCLNCHAQTCSGPIVAIRPLAIGPLPDHAPKSMFE